MKILFIDNWTKGIRNFSRLTPLLEKEGFSYKLVHLESWDGDCQKYQRISDIDCYDISSYKSQYLYKVIKQESPDVVLILSLSYLFDRAVASMCTYMGVKVVYLAHGKLYMKTGVGDLNKKKLSFQRIYKKLHSKSIRMLINYIRFNTFTRFRPDLIYKTLKEFILHNERTMFTPYTDEFRVDAGMVFYESERDMFINQRCFPPDMIHAVGNPEVDDIINKEILDRKIFLESLSLSDYPYALYMDDGFTQESILSVEEWKNFILEMLKPLKERGWQMIIKLHPRTDITSMGEFFKANNILTIKDSDLKNLVYHSEFVFSHSSSTIIYGMIMDKAVVLPRWGKLENLIRNYPDDTVLYCDTINDYYNFLSGNLKGKDISKYLRSTCGNLDGKSRDRIVNIIKDVCSH